MPYSHSTALALRDPPPVTVLLLARSLPVAGSGSQAQNRRCETARARHAGSFAPFPSRLMGGPGPAGCWVASLHTTPAWAQLASQIQI